TLSNTKTVSGNRGSESVDGYRRFQRVAHRRARFWNEPILNSQFQMKTTTQRMTRIVPATETSLKLRIENWRDRKSDRQHPLARGDFPSFHRQALADHHSLAVQSHRGADMPRIAVKTIAHGELVRPRCFHH